ncbi:uncharacterized protein YALI1_B10170g [Yarrowia lipolytica]|uniref:Uncharacterized protein n=1 Tax=Yarrowia lipolytica TaxID=4952 RepID=A0A1D8N6W1_YARLL|nr:hypothetical protein YALI1_B10170g [Yarrowia lipolytica]
MECAQYSHLTHSSQLFSCKCCVPPVAPNKHERRISMMLSITVLQLSDRETVFSRHLSQTEARDHQKSSITHKIEI